MHMYHSSHAESIAANIWIKHATTWYTILVFTVLVSPILSSTQTLVTTTSESEPCGEHTQCFYVELLPQLHANTVTEVILQHHDDSSITTFNVQFLLSNDVACEHSTLAFDFELIDYDDVAEYIQIYDLNQNGSMLQQCGGGIGRQCNVFTPCDLQNVSIDLQPFEPYTLSVVESKHVDPLCAEHHNYTINAKLSLSCFAHSQTTEPASTSPTITETEQPHVDTHEVFVFVCHYLDRGEHDPVTYKTYGLLMSQMVLQALDYERILYNVSFPTGCSCAVCAVFNTMILSPQNETDCFYASKVNTNLVTILHEDDEHRTEATAGEGDEEYVAIFTIHVDGDGDELRQFKTWLLSIIQSDEFRFELSQKMNAYLLSMADSLHTAVEDELNGTHRFEVEWIEIISNETSSNSTRDSDAKQSDHDKSPIVFLCVGAGCLLFMCLLTIIASPKHKEPVHGQNEPHDAHQRNVSTEQLMWTQIQHHQSIKEEREEHEPQFVMTAATKTRHKYDIEDSRDEQEEEEMDDDEEKPAKKVNIQQFLEAVGESVENHDAIRLCFLADDSNQVIVSPDGVIIDELVSKPRSSYTTISGEFIV